MDQVKIRGRISGVLLDAQGNPVQLIRKENQVVEGGFYTLARCLVGNQDPPNFWFKVGDDNRETEESMEMLAAEKNGGDVAEASESSEVSQENEEVSVDLKITFEDEFNMGELGIYVDHPEEEDQKILFARVNLSPAVVAMAGWEIEMEWAFYIGRA